MPDRPPMVDLEKVVPCEINTKCLDEIIAALGQASGMSGTVKDRVAAAVKRFCSGPVINDALKDKVLRSAARQFVDPLHKKIGEIGEGISICLAAHNPPLTVGQWKAQVVRALRPASGRYGGSEAYLASIMRLLATHYNTNLLTAFCAEGGLKNLGSCATLGAEASCFQDLAPWIVGNCLEKAGFTVSSLFSGEDPEWNATRDSITDIIIACSGLQLNYDIVVDDKIQCHGVLEYKLEGGGGYFFQTNDLGVLVPLIVPNKIFASGKNPYKTTNELNGLMKAVAAEVKPIAKEQLRKSYELIWSQIALAYDNKLIFQTKLKDAVTHNIEDGLALIVDHVLGEVAGSISCANEAQLWWANYGIGANTDDCFNDLKDATVPFEDSVAPIGWHNIPITPPPPGATEVDVPLPGGGGFKKMPWPPTPGPIWDSYVEAETRGQPDAHNQCKSARKVKWSWSGTQIDITYVFNPSAAWVTNTGIAAAIAACQLGKIKGGKIGKLLETMKNLVAIFNKTRGPCGLSPLYYLVSSLSPEVGNTQFIGLDPATCEYIVPGPGFVNNPERGGEWPPAGQPGNPGGPGLPLPDDCKFYPVFVTTAERQQLGLILPVLKAVLNTMLPVGVNWDKTQAEIEVWIQAFEKTLDEACS